MSNLWHNIHADAATSVGSFAIGRTMPVFRPWASGLADDAIDDMPSSRDLAEIEAEAFTQGFEEGRRTSEEMHTADRAALADLIRSIETLNPEPTDALAALLAETVDRLVRQIVGEVSIDAALLASRAENAAQLIGEETAPGRLRLNPADIALLEGEEFSVALVGDAEIARGSLRLECAGGWIEDGPEIRLQRLRDALDRMGA